ncbi:hypothetical protein HPB48_008490 [Haemaphysalis longicornis]|uniref:Uncharacterized protein n=1 Tax=Haemaphysalis longicornis TaxID=44386 RepID=A0A9J6GP87_HAELO|nr:hypothetical protein HPB48_008490 [Haemaphysalis longicornis]
MYVCRGVCFGIDEAGLQFIGPDVCQAICDRVGILSAGKLECLGSVPQLLAKFGQGFTLQVKCTAKEASKSKDVEEAVRTLFPGIDLTDVHPQM